MEAQGWMMLKVLLNKYSKVPADILLKKMPQEDAQLVLSQDIQSKDITPAITEPSKIIAKIHYSWMPPFIEQFPESLQGPLLNALPSSQASGLARLMKKNRDSKQLSEPVKHFLIRQLYDKLDDKQILPIPYLPLSSLNVLAEMSKEELVQMIDFLALQDLAEAIRSIVDKKKLKSLYLWLSPKEQQYLKTCLNQKDKLPLTKIELGNWENNKDKLKLLLHRRGLVRFAKVLSGQHPDLLWHIIHILDTGRAAVINKQYTKESIPGVTPTLIQQLTNLMNFLKQKSES